MNPLIFNFNHFYINTYKNKPNYIYLNPKKKTINTSNEFLISNIILTENNNYIINCCIKEQKLIEKQQKVLTYDTKFAKVVFKYLIKQKTLNLNPKWDIIPFYNGLTLYFDIINHSIIYTQFDKSITLLEEVPLIFSNKLIKKILQFSNSKSNSNSLNEYDKIKTFFKIHLNYDDDINLLNYETLQTIFKSMIYTNKIKLLSILIDINIFPIYIKSKLQLKTIILEKHNTLEKYCIKVIWNDLLRWIC